MDTAYFYSKEHGEDICYYPDDLEYSFTVLGCGYESGKAYNITFDESGNIEEIEQL